MAEYYFTPKGIHPNEEDHKLISRIDRHDFISSMALLNNQLGEAERETSLEKIKLGMLASMANIYFIL